MSRVDCDDFRKFIDPYVDGEFDDRERADFDAHLATCASCRRHYEHQAWFLRAVRPALRRPQRLPPGVRERLQARLHVAQRPARMRRVARRLMVPVPALAVASAVGLLVMPLTGFKPAPMVDDAVEQHCTDYPVEFPSPEIAEVNAWFQDKVPFRMAAPAFPQERVTLLGGRLSRIGGGTDGPNARAAAYLMYSVGRRKMTVLVFDGSDLSMGTGETRQVGNKQVRLHDANGYKVALYQRGPLVYAVTSDLPQQDMLDLIGETF